MSLVKFTISSALQRTLLQVGAFFLVILIILLSNNLSFISSFRETIQSKAVATGTWLRDWHASVFVDTEALTYEYEQLQYSFGMISLDAARMQELEERVLELESLLDYESNNDEYFIVSRILARSLDDDDAVILDIGRDDGSAVGLPVVEQGHMIGVIKEVGDQHSVVQLLQHKDTRIPITVLGAGETIGLIEGREGFLLGLDFVPQGTDIQEGDVIMTSGIEGLYPNGLIIGVVDSLNTDESETFISGLVQPVFNADSYNYVAVIHPYLDAYADEE